MRNAAHAVFARHRFPHSGIPGSKVAQHLPGAYRSHATPFIGISRQGIHATPFVSWSTGGIHDDFGLAAIFNFQNPHPRSFGTHPQKNNSRRKGRALRPRKDRASSFDHSQNPEPVEGGAASPPKEGTRG